MKSKFSICFSNQTINYKSLLPGVAGLILFGGCCFCSDPLKRPTILPRDTFVYMDEGGQQKQDLNEITKSPVVIGVSHGDFRNAKPAANALESNLKSKLNALAYFTVIDRSNTELQNEKWINEIYSSGNKIPDIPESKYLVTARINNFQITSRYIEATQNTPGRTVYDFSMSVDFQCFDTHDKSMIESSVIGGKNTSNNSHDEALEKASEVARKCAEDFVTKLTVKFAPEVRVLETRDGGHYALIPLGEKHGYAKHIKVEFLEYVDYSPTIQREPRIFAGGIVMCEPPSTGRMAWIRVYDYKDANVKTGHYVRLKAD